MDDGITWENPGDDAAFPAFFGVRRGKAAVAEAFAFIRANFAITLFDVRRLLAEDDTVVAILRIERTVIPTGKLLAQEVIHRWTLSGGRITGFHDYHDSDGIARALS